MRFNKRRSGGARNSDIWLIVVVLELYFYVTLVALTAPYFGRHIFSGKPTAKYYSSSLIALLTLINGSLGEGADFAGKFIVRVVLITLAVLYFVTTLKVLVRFWPVEQAERVVKEQKNSLPDAFSWVGAQNWG